MNNNLTINLILFCNIKFSSAKANKIIFDASIVTDLRPVGLTYAY